VEVTTEVVGGDVVVGDACWTTVSVKTSVQYGMVPAGRRPDRFRQASFLGCALVIRRLPRHRAEAPAHTTIVAAPRCRHLGPATRRRASGSDRWCPLSRRSAPRQPSTAPGGLPPSRSRWLGDRPVALLDSTERRHQSERRRRGRPDRPERRGVKLKSVSTWLPSTSVVSVALASALWSTVPVLTATAGAAKPSSSLVKVLMMCSFVLLARDSSRTHERRRVRVIPNRPRRRDRRQ